MRVLLFVSVLAILACLGTLIAVLLASNRQKKREGNSRQAWKN